ncbi:MAG: glycosyltransferase family 2 protein [Solirubrobacterales bacterium]|nr:glycosyltransferase family 2 protein [Solirubrobacterales bacterium]MBV8948318.1 glycosyltransferase family 2 protein [Solirubrobacterales bacterium]MBV9363667.1 glycosyltransferase family 2 protein [Solirubrobacterales bacterium]MBV9681699.1 glycosyltransferase family 2 protein [Solirubrobacterales bacterium]MBV9807043.1 glycosyltransferase family 2 protein [Solirubrobacterales bacterium]
MTTSVVIATYHADRVPDLLATIDSLARQTSPAHEVIVAVDGNPDLASTLSRDLPDVTVVENIHHAGAGGARNSGASVASGDLVAFIDDDAVAAVDWIAQIEKAMTDARAIGVGGLIEPLWLDHPPRWFPTEFGWVIGCSHRGLPETRTAVRNVWAGNMAMRRDRFQAVGGFRADFGKQADRSEPEETDLCIRAGRRWPDLIWVYDPRVRVLHRVPRARGRVGYFLRRCLYEGRGKAALAAHVGARDALTEEKAYVRHVLPRGMVDGARELVSGGDLYGLMRTCAIVAGCITAFVGYVPTRVRGQVQRRLRPYRGRRLG